MLAAPALPRPLLPPPLTDPPPPLPPHPLLLQVLQLPGLRSLQVHGRAGPLEASWGFMSELAPTLQRLRVADFEGLPRGLVAALGSLTSLRLLELVDLRGDGARVRRWAGGEGVGAGGAALGCRAAGPAPRAAAQAVERRRGRAFVPVHNAPPGAAASLPASKV